MRRSLAQDPSNKIELLDSAEFATLAGLVVSAGTSNRRLNQGHPVQKEFAKLLPPLMELSAKVPDWTELRYFVAWIADKARDSKTAVKYYGEVAGLLDPTQHKELIVRINKRLTVLAPVEAPTTTAGTPVSIAHALDYSSHIKFVRDSGAEGSVVGLALATALEYQIAKATHNDLRISARYIYYAGRAENVDLNAPYGKGPAVFGMTRSPRVEGIVLV